MNYDFPVTQLPQFSEYVYFEKALFPHEITRALDLWDNRQAVDATISGEDGDYNHELRKSNVTFVSNNESSQWLFHKLALFIMQCNRQYYGFELSGILEELQFAEYGTEDHFNWHMDFGRGEISHRKLSVTAQLSDPADYEGGDLEFMINDRTITAPRTQGTIIVFPSFVMHRVTPVTKGVRRSVVAWASGQPFR